MRVRPMLEDYLTRLILIIQLVRCPFGIQRARDKELRHIARNVITLVESDISCVAFRTNNCAKKKVELWCLDASCGADANR